MVNGQKWVFIASDEGDIGVCVYHLIDVVGHFDVKMAVAYMVVN